MIDWEKPIEVCHKHSGLIKREAWLVLPTIQWLRGKIVKWMGALGTCHYDVFDENGHHVLCLDTLDRNKYPIIVRNKKEVK